MSAKLFSLASALLLALQCRAAALQPSNLLAACATNRTYSVVSGDNCGTIARFHGVPRAALVTLNEVRPDCAELRVGQVLCLPEPCQLYDIGLGTTCTDITDATGIALSQLLAWNPYINAECTNLIAGEQVCIAEPGVLPTPTPTPTPSASRTVAKRDYATQTVSPPGPVPHGTTPNCGHYYQVKSGDFCDMITDQFNIDPELFHAINPAINVDCTNLVPGLYYCVMPTENWNQTTTTVPASSYATAPAPTPSGTTGHCYEYYVVRSGDTCMRIASLYGVSLEDLRLWNPSLKEDCSNLRPGQAYCIRGEHEDATSPRWVAAEPTAV
ncbi:hypothetical protein BJX61DRAFT_213163 [Aspergillus egyptiacus]|nr:hypothetical protein BJX61DRAFT_213163 [Aspergillus egyptiacus]